MPFLRIIRDKRGYETTYLMHWYRDGNRQRSRILCVFRTPGGVRVGRDAMEPDVLRSIEAQYPDIEFDWKAVVANQQVVEPVVDLRRPRKRRRSEDEGEASRPSGSAAPAAPARAEPGSAPPQSRPPIPSAIQGTTPEEQIAFLTTWYPAVRERIPRRTADPTRQEALLALAERLNPAAWTDADQIAAGLVQAAEALERLSHVFSKRRRRPRRSKGATPQLLQAPASASAPAEPAPAPEPESELEPEPEPEPDTPSDL